MQATGRVSAGSIPVMLRQIWDLCLGKAWLRLYPFFVFFVFETAKDYTAQGMKYGAMIAPAGSLRFTGPLSVKQLICSVKRREFGPRGS